MKRAATIAVLCVAVVAAAAGCGGGKSPAALTTTTAPKHDDVSQTTSAAALVASAKEALDKNYRLSVYVLWHNEIPASAQRSTRGPALTSLRSAAANRRKRGVRIKTLSTRRTVTTLRLDPSYTTATAVVVARQRVQPSDLNGRPLGHPITVRERGRFTLHRVGRASQFVVWKVVQLP